MVQIFRVNNEQFTVHDGLLRVSVLLPEVFTIVGARQVSLKLTKAGVVCEVLPLCRIGKMLSLQNIVDVCVPQDLQVVFLRLAAMEIEFSVHKHEPRELLKVCHVIDVICSFNLLIVQINQVEEL